MIGFNKRYDEILLLVAAVECKNFEFVVSYERTEGRDRPYLQIQCDDTCTQTGEDYRWNGRKWFLSLYMTDSEVVQTCWAAVKMATEHELRETFKWEGQPIFRPHFDIRALHDISKKGWLDVRGEM